MTGIIAWVDECGDGVCIEREQPSIASELMTTLSGLSLGVQTLGPSKSANTVPAVSAGINARMGTSRSQMFKRWLEEYLKQQQEAAAEQKAEEEQAAFEAQKQAYKDDADFVFEHESGSIDLTKIEGVDSSKNMFIEVTGNYGVIQSGEGDDVFYFSGNQNYFFDGDIATGAPGTLYCMTGLGGAGNDKFFGGDGTQIAVGDLGNDLIDLGDGFDVAHGGTGADEFVIDLQNSGYDFITDFVHVGDKITIYNGGELAQSGDWMLVSVGSEWTGSKPPTSNYNDMYEGGHEFYEIQSADGATAARFIAGKMAHNTSVNFQITVQQGVAELEVIEMEYGYPITESSVDFV